MGTTNVSWVCTTCGWVGSEPRWDGRLPVCQVCPYVVQRLPRLADLSDQVPLLSLLADAYPDLAAVLDAADSLAEFVANDDLSDRHSWTHAEYLAHKYLARRGKHDC